MSTTMRRAALPFAAALAAIGSPALGDDTPPAAEKDDGPKFEGDVRAGWRFVSREDEGRYPQDHALKDGPRIFDLNLLATDRRSGYAHHFADDEMLPEMLGADATTGIDWLASRYG